MKENITTKLSVSVYRGQSSFQQMHKMYLYRKWSVICRQKPNNWHTQTEINTIIATSTCRVIAPATTTPTSILK